MKKVIVLFLMTGTLALYGTEGKKIKTKQSEIIRSDVKKKKEVNRSNQLNEKYKITTQDMKNWEKTFSKVVIGESELEDWYGAGNPIEFLYRNAILNEKKVKFLDSLKTKEKITDKDMEEFNSILSKAIKKLPRKYNLKNENIKNPIELVKYMVKQSNQKINNPSNHILNKVALFEEKKQIIEFSKKSDLTQKEVTKLRKILNKIIGRTRFYNESIWYIVEISPRMEEVNKMNKKKIKNKQDLNNINAKAFYIAYSEYLSKLDKWDN